MTIGSHLEEFHDLPVHRFPKSVKDRPGAAGLPAPESVAWNITVDSYDTEEGWEEAFGRFLASVDTEKVRALVVGAWNEVYDNGPEKIVQALVAAKDRLPSLRALFLGDIVMEECEISWINQGNVGPLLEAFPELEEFGVRGGQGLVFPPLRHERLRSLTVETGGMPAEAVRGVAGSDLPALVELDLWLGTSSTAATARWPTWRRSSRAPGSPPSSIWGCATARCRTTSARPWPPPRWWPASTCWTCRWASSPTTARPRS